MKRQFLFIVAMIAMVFMACEEEKENVNNSSNSSSKKETTYSIKNYTNSTITDIKVYELDANNITISSADFNSCGSSEYIYDYYNRYFTAKDDAESIKISYKIAGQTFTNTFRLRKGDKTEIIIERPANLTTYTVTFRVSADWDDDDYLYYVSVEELNSNYSVVKEYEYYRILGVGTVLDEVKASSTAKVVKAYFYFYPEKGHDGCSSKEFTLIPGEHNEFIVYVSECTFFCKNSKEGEGLLLTNGDDVKK